MFNLNGVGIPDNLKYKMEGAFKKALALLKEKTQNPPNNP